MRGRSPSKQKDAATATAGSAEVLRQATPRFPARLQTDKGLELFNSQFAALMKRHKIEHFASNSDLKAACVERFNRTLKHAFTLT